MTDPAEDLLRQKARSEYLQEHYKGIEEMGSARMLQKFEAEMLHPLQVGNTKFRQDFHEGRIPSYRGTGRTQIQAFRILASAMEMPRVPYKVTDHSDTVRGSEELWYRIAHMVQQMQLQHYKFHRTAKEFFVTFL